MTDDPSQTDSPETAARDEWALLVAAQHGDTEALTQLYESRVRRVYCYLYSLVGNGPDAEDLTSTTCLQAFEALPRYHPGGSFTA
jgi:DNA-directed RNA polymerase specialized sigma24 family protein